MKKISAIFGIVFGGINAFALLHTVFTEGFESDFYSYYDSWGYYSYGALTVNTGLIFFLLAAFAVSICLIVFSALVLRQGRQKSFAITALVLSCVLLAIVPIILFWIYLAKSGTRKNKTDKEFDRMAFLKKAYEEKIISDADYKKLMLEEIEKN